MKIAIVNSSELGNNLSADFHVNRTLGKSPYKLKDNQYEAANGGEIKSATYLSKEQLLLANVLLEKKKQIEDSIGDAINQVIE